MVFPSFDFIFQLFSTFNTFNISTHFSGRILLQISPSFRLFITFKYFHIFSHTFTIFHDRNSIKAAARGSWRTVVVDDVVPADCNRPGWPRACRPNGPLWPSVIEKAFAKACGGYEKMDFVPRKKKSNPGDVFFASQHRSGGFLR